MARKIIVLEVNDDIRRQIIRELKVLGTSSLFTLFSLSLDFSIFNPFFRGVQFQQNRRLLRLVSKSTVDTDFNMYGVS